MKNRAIWTTRWARSRSPNDMPCDPNLVSSAFYTIPFFIPSLNFLFTCLLSFFAAFSNNYIMMMSIKRVSKRIILQYTLQEEVQFPCKISGPLFTWFTCFDLSMTYNVLSRLIFSRNETQNYMPMH